MSGVVMLYAPSRYQRAKTLFNRRVGQLAVAVNRHVLSCEIVALNGAGGGGGGFATAVAPPARSAPPSATAIDVACAAVVRPCVTRSGFGKI
jgi:hypothetical protein